MWNIGTLMGLWACFTSSGLVSSKMRDLEKIFKFSSLPLFSAFLLLLCSSISNYLPLTAKLPNLFSLSLKTFYSKELKQTFYFFFTLKFSIQYSLRCLILLCFYIWHSILQKFHLLKMFNTSPTTSPHTHLSCKTLLSVWGESGIQDWCFLF